MRRPATLPQTNHPLCARRKVRQYVQLQRIATRHRFARKHRRQRNAADPVQRTAKEVPTSESLHDGVALHVIHG